MQPRSNVRLIVYRFPAPVEGLSEPRQSPSESATGTSSRSNRCMCHWPSINLTCPIISRDWSPLFHQYRPGCVGGVVVRGRGVWRSVVWCWSHAGQARPFRGRCQG